MSSGILHRDRAWRLAAAFVSGALLQFVSPPIGLAWLHWFSFVPVLLALEPDNRRGNFRLGYVCGFFGVFFLFFWLANTIDTFSNIPLPLAAAIVGLFAAVFGAPYGFLMLAPRFLRQAFGGLWVWLFPAIWVFAEFIQPALFPYFQGVGQYRVPYIWQGASIFGSMGLSYLILAVNSAIAELWLSRGKAWIHIAVAAAIFVANLGFGYWRYNSIAAELAAPETQIVRAAVVQQGVTMVERLQDRGPKVLKSWEALTAKVIPLKPDLVVWPEGSIYYNPADPKLAEHFGAMTKDYGFDFLVGGGTTQVLTDSEVAAETARRAGDHSGGRYGALARLLGLDDSGPVTKRQSWNSCYLFGRDGTIKGRYDKMVPLPFGEYLPWPVSYLRPYIEGVGNFQKGTEATVFDTGSFTFSTPICYEAILDAQMRRLANVDLFVNITNDGWFGDTAAPHQHAMLAAVHAMEFGRPMLRIAYTGISMVVEPHGDITFETQPYTEVAAVVPVRLRSYETPYRTWGRAFPWVCSAVALGSLFLGRRRGVTA